MKRYTMSDEQAKDKLAEVSRKCYLLHPLVHERKRWCIRFDWGGVPFFNLSPLVGGGWEYEEER